MPLTKVRSPPHLHLPLHFRLARQTEQKHLKGVRRKIKNKLSAQESRRKKKEYVEGLEERVDTCTHTNTQLRQRVKTLEGQNKTLLQQLQRLQAVVAGLCPSKLQAGSLLMVLSLSFTLLIWPRPTTTPTSSYSVSVHSRSLLFMETDDFGNLIDPESGAVVSEQGGLSPKPPYPWTHQTPAFLHPNTHTERYTFREL
ncbi:Cyclic AMP-responsive element-binding protein 3-like protein 3 [Geodia barretti]|uniref:Cyclic AMP-responsive element-binding protein 3-like protein 3 n=1 Tax=Geodia barretti TaxID=519541 RepID=A0AA35RKJ2_GEOBA|nr:Cyclic AMP-responsive element-binding protein 3-like protein 3 [Geodia barretti]